MRSIFKYKLIDPESFKQRILVWGSKYSAFCYLDSNNYYNSCSSDCFYHTYETIAGVDLISSLEASENSAFISLKKYVGNKQDWLLGYLSYDLKNEIENFTSDNIDELKFPEIYFFQPRFVFIIKGNNLEIHYIKGQYTANDMKLLIDTIENMKLETYRYNNNFNIKSRIRKQDYINTVKEVQKHINRGDIYEMNLCQEYYCENCYVNPLFIYLRLKAISPAPFSCFIKLSDKFLISASPERFLKKMGSKIISQPMKGTINRGSNSRSDKYLKNKLKLDPKEISENVMIVDLVRNDLSKSAEKESVKVEELCGIYTFEQVHQMISTVSARLDYEKDMIDAIRNAFPMGSMTGAPKVKAMELIEKYEKTKRGLYSGAVGYFTPQNDFDLNVVIRSILYNSTRKYLSYIVGGAITAKSIPENEYRECLLKANAINQVLNQ